MVKLAVVGCGGIMHEHYRHLSEMEGVTFAGHCDIERGLAEAASARYGGEAFADFEPMLDKIKPEAIYICVPPFAHGPIEEAAAERGIHMFIEKPVALARETATRIAEAVRKTKVITSTGYCWRYYDTVTAAKRMLQGKAVSLVSGYYTAGMPPVWWWRRMEKSGGQLVEQTTHIFDLLRYLCGEIAEVHAIASRGCMNKVKEYDVDDSSVVAMRLKSGASAAMISTCVLDHSGRSGLDIMTPEMTLQFCNGALKVTEDHRTTEYRPTVNIYEEENRAFIEAVVNGKRGRIRCAYPDAVKTLQVSLAANESIRSGLPIKP